MTGIGRDSATSWDPALYLDLGDHRSRPFHDLLARIGATDPPRRQVTTDLRDGTVVLDPAGYADLLAGTAVDAWETTYLQRLTGADPVLSWIGATALRPVRDALPEPDHRAFRAELAPRLRAAYPAAADGTTWFPFRRVFAVART